MLVSVTEEEIGGVIFFIFFVIDPNIQGDQRRMRFVIFLLWGDIWRQVGFLCDFI